MDPRFPHLFSPLRIGSHTLKNRIVSTSHDAHYGAGGLPTSRYIAYHVAKARGGAGLVQAFGTASVHPTSTSGAGNINIWDDSVIAPFRDLADQVHSHGALITAQLVHRGRRATGLITRQPPIGPSDVPNERTGETPRVMSVSDIHEMIAAYAEAAERTVRGGFDGVELAVYGDMLPDQFLSPVVNTRTDDYGGDFDRRLRFCVELFHAVRDAIGADRLLIARVTADDFLPGELNATERLEVARRFDALGVIDVFSVVGGTIKSITGRAKNVPSAYFPKGVYLSLAAPYKQALRAPVLYAGRIVDPAHAETAVGDGLADLIGMTRAIIADPEMPRKAEEGRIDDIRTCVGANQCIGRLYMGLPIECVQNPTIGRENELEDMEPATRTRRVVVVGGGPGGLEAARVAATRGHEVVLLERSEEVGGQILTAARAPGREDLVGIPAWLSKQLAKLGVEVRTKLEASVPDVLELGPDAVVIATGSIPRRPSAQMNGGSGVVFAQDVLNGVARPEGRVLIISDDPFKFGPTTADFLAAKGHDVVIIAPHYTIADGVDDTVKPVLLGRLIEQGVELHPLQQAVEVRDGRVVAQHVLTGHLTTFEADSIVAACGNHAHDPLSAGLEGQVEELHVVGDALAPRGIHEALLDATRAARLI